MSSNITKSQIRDEMHRQLAAQAIEHALNGRWDEAIHPNQQLVEMSPDDSQARNRLGNAFMQLGRYEEALETYEQCLQRQPSNNIARKKTAELYALLKREPPAPLAALGSPLELSEGEDELLDEAEEYAELDEEEEETDTSTDEEGD
jgi:Flp pilus assembly protein TadD